ncbi:MAG TPA: hypothetical protein DCQ31_14210 [Bacteroidales bacterium]|nr:hypothetical protein [Bacteroidales bacterium]
MPNQNTENQELLVKYTNLLATIPLGYIETDADRRIKNWNPAAEKLFGYSYAEAVGKNFFDLFNFEAEKVLQFNETKNSSQVFEHMHQTAKGKLFCRWNAVIVQKYTTIDSISFLVEDISKLRETEDRLQIALDKEIELNNLKSNFIANTSHQFRTPLTTILSNTEMLEVLLAGKINDENIKIDRFITRIYDNIERMNLLLSDLVLSGKLQANTTIIQAETVKFIDIVKQTIGNENLPNLHGRSFEVKEIGTPKNLYADKHLLAIVVNNLLSNALKYSNDNPILTIEYLTDSLQFSVTDHGIGIPEDEQVNLFQTFFRASNVENIGGTGLGLFLVHQYVKLHGGTVTFTSKPTYGTTFIVTLPYNCLK